MHSLVINFTHINKKILLSYNNFYTNDPAAGDEMITVRHRSKLIPRQINSKLKNMKFEDPEKNLKLSQSVKSEQLHHKIIDELNRLSETHDNVKLRTICSDDHCKKGIFHATGAVCTFCFKEGCRLLHLLDCIGVIGLTTTTLSITNKQLHLTTIDEFKKLGDAPDNNVKRRNIRNYGPCKKAGTLQDAGVVYKFCFKEGCRLLHHLNYIGVIGLTTATLSITSKPLHHKIIDEFKKLGDTLENNVKLRTIRNNGPCQKAKVLQDAGVVYKFCFKEGCRLLHHLNYIGVIGLTTATLSITSKPLHHKIIDELNMLGDTLDNNVKLQTIRNNGPCQKAKVLQEAGVVYKFCFKEGCRLLHHLDYIGMIGLTTTTLRPSHLPSSTWRAEKPPRETLKTVACTVLEKPTSIVIMQRCTTSTDQRLLEPS
jgi:hypothetical protein